MQVTPFNSEDYVVSEPCKGLPSSLPLVQLDPKTGKFCVNKKATEFLRSIPNLKLGSISVVGPYRTGKSYLLSRMLNSSNGFELGPTMNGCTKGIWISTKILVPKNPNKPTIIFLDTEGIGDVKKDSAHDVAIASLSILLSSYFIYNSTGVTRSDDLEKLE